MIRPLPGYCVVEPIEEKAKTVGGVYLPEVSTDKPMRGRVIKVGSETVDEKGRKRDAGVTEGEIVIYKKWVNETIKEKNKEYIFVRFEDLLGVYEN